MSTWNRLMAPAIACGLALVAGTTARAQVVEDRPAPATTTTTTTTTSSTIAQDDQAPAGGGVDVVRRVSEILSGEARGPGEAGRIAAISDLIMDAQGKPHYVLLSRGGVAGVGGDKIAVPFGSGTLQYVEDGGWQLLLDMTGDRLQQAPTLEEGSLAQLRDQAWLQSTRQFFQADADGNQAGTGDDSLLFRASALRGAQVRGNAGDESIANVDDVLLDPELNASYAVLGYGGVAGLGKNQVPVPFDRLQLSADTEGERTLLVVSIDMTKEQLQSDTSPRLDGEYNRMLDPTYTQRVREYFGSGAGTGTTGSGLGTTGSGTTGTTGSGAGTTGSGTTGSGTIEPRPQP